MYHAFVVLDQHHCIRSYSPNLCDITGYPSSELLGRDFESLFAPSEPTIAHLLTQAQQGQDVEQTLVFLLTRDARLRPVFVRLSRTVGVAGTEPGLVAVLSDENAQHVIEDERSRATHREHRLREIALTINSVLDHEKVLHHVVRLSTELVNADGGALSLVADHGNWFAKPYTYRLPDVFSKDEVSRQARLGWSIMEAGEPALISDYQHHPSAIPLLKQAGVASLMAFPLTVGRERFGILALYMLNTTRRFTQRDLELVEIVARQASIALQNIRLYDAVKRRAEEAETLRRSGAAVAATLNQEEAIDRILEQLALVVPYDSASVQLLRGQYLEIVGGRGFQDPSAVIGLRFSIDSDSPSAQVYRQRQPLVLGDAPSSYDVFRNPPHNHIRSWLGVPLIFHDRFLGKLAIDSREPFHFSEHHVRLASAFADQVAIALENARLFAEAQLLATTDPLTGLWNRRHFFTLARQQFEQSRRYDRMLSVMMMDIDHFKTINDTFGHAIGDQVLRTVARWCYAHMREVDVIGRYGGEEFAMALPETGLAEALVVAERLRDAIGRLTVETERGPVTVSASFGVASIGPSTPDLDALLNQADVALYMSKKAGRNRIEGYAAEA